MAGSGNVHDIQKLYVAYLGRPADPAGLAFWAGQLEQNRDTGLAAVKTALSTSAEFTSASGGLSTEQVVDQLYVGLFDRHPDAAGLMFWANMLQNGTITLADLVSTLADAAQDTDLNVLNNKIAAAEAFTAGLDTGAEISGYGNPAAGALAKAYITAVTDNASLAVALAALPDTITKVTGAQPNNVPTGAVTASGTAVQGQVLSASHTLADADGLGTVAYQWKAAGVAINGATSDTFTLTAAQVGKPITVTASYTDGMGTHESVTSNVIVSGNDTLNGSAEADQLAGGAGHDTYVVNVGGDVIVENVGEGTDLVRVAYTAAGSYTLAANVENAMVASAAVAVNLVGNALDNVLIGNAAANTLNGNAGNDTLDGGAGADKLTGGSGNDSYVVDVAGDVVTELAGEGTDSVRTTLATYALTANVENLAYTGTTAFTGTGNALDNIITGGNGNNKLDGGAGNDTLAGGAGADSLLGGGGNDSFEGVGGKDTVDGGDGVDVLRLTGYSNEYTIARPTAADTMLTDRDGNVTTIRNVESVEFYDQPVTLRTLQYNIPSSENDELYSWSSDRVTMDGGLGADTMHGNSGETTYIIDNAGDTIVEEFAYGTDTALVALTAAGTTYTLATNVENGVVTSAAAINLMGNQGDNALTGNAAANTLTGLGGNDTLDGGAGADKLIGGDGDDLYIVAEAGDVVTENADGGRDTVSTTLASYTLSANVEELIYAGKGAFTGTGNALSNQLTAGDGGNKLDGGAGDDVLIGGAGADSLMGGAGDDVFVAAGGGGKDTIDGGDGADQLNLNNYQQEYTVSRPNAIDTVLTDKAGNEITVRNVERFWFAGEVSLDELQFNIRSAGNDRLVGTDGNDTMDGGLGADTMGGGGGEDTYIIDNIGDTIVEGFSWDNDTARVGINSAGATYVLADNIETGIVTSAAAINLTGNASDNALTGNAAANTLTGGAGNDTLDGGAGADKLIGGDGDDLYIVAEAGDVVTESADGGRDSVNTTLASYTLNAHVEELAYTGKAAFTGIGNALSNRLAGGDGGNKLDGGAGDDVLIGGTGADSLVGGAGDDIFVAGGGKDTIDGGDGSDQMQLPGGLQNYTVSRPNAIDTVLTDKAGNTITVRNVERFGINGEVSLDELQFNIRSTGNDRLVGTADNDTMDGGLGADTMSGWGGEDTYIIDNIGDTIVEEFSWDNDTALVGISSAGATYVLGENVKTGIVTSAAAINLTGNASDNLLTGNATANTLIGGGGDDRLDGGAGADKLAGGVGNDIYIVADSGDVATENADEGWDNVRASVATYTLGANIEVLTYTGTGAFTGTGNAGDNYLIGGNGGNKLDGGAGNDVLVGGAGNDSLSGGLGADELRATRGKDTIDGGDGGDTLVLDGDLGDYTVSRPNLTDTVFTGKAGNAVTVRNVEYVAAGGSIHTMADVQRNVVSPGGDELVGTDYDDTLDGGAGADTMAGGNGDDTYVIADQASQIVEDLYGGRDTARVALTTAGAGYTLADHVEVGVITSTAAVNLSGNELDNELTGNAAANVLSGGGGNDILAGGAGNDKLIGGSGNDTYLVADAGDVVTELADDGIDTVDTALAGYTLGANVEALNYTGTGAFSGTGNALANVITGGAGADKLDGAGGDDTLAGGGGNDSLLGGAGDDRFDAGTGKDTIDGGLDTDTVVVGGYEFEYVVTRPNAIDTVLTDAGGNALVLRNVETVVFWDRTVTIAQLQYNIGTVGNDHLYGSTAGGQGASYAFPDLLDGGPGIDTLEGYAGNDTYVIADAASVVLEEAGAGSDLVQVALTRAGTYALADNVEDATVTAAASVAVNLTGNALDNHLTGNAAANTLAGGLGNDTLDGGLGNDALRGGDGDDLYRVGEAGDTVTELAGGGVDTVATTLASYTLGANLEMLEYDGTALFTGTGNALDNLILAGDGGSKLDGGAGDDVLAGGRGNDNLLGGAGNDAFFSGAGRDTVDGGAGSDRLSALDYFGNYTVTRPNATDVVLTHRSGASVTVHDVEFFDFADATLTVAELRENIASPGNDAIHGSGGRDTLDGGAGNDTLSGGFGDDVYRLSAAGDVVVEMPDEGLDLAVLDFAAAGSYTMADNLEQVIMVDAARVAINVVGNALDNYIGGNAAANNLAGGAGNDVLAGGAGNDTLTGGGGDDEYQVAETADVIVEKAGEGVDHVFSKAAVYTLGANVERLIFNGSGAFTGTGNADANQLFAGSSNAAKLDGGAGNDTLVGGAGNDNLAGGLGDDQLEASGGRDTLDGGAGFDVANSLGAFSGYKVTRTTATDTVLTDANGVTTTVRGVEHFYFDGVGMTLAQVQNNSGGIGNDVIAGTAGGDVLDGGVGADTMVGGDGDDTYVADNAGDVATENAGEGDDLVSVTMASGTYVLGINVESAVVVSTGAVHLTGNASDNLLAGNAAANRLAGGDGDDMLVGNAGNDTMVGGAGDDLYLVEETGDVITELAGGGLDTVLTKASAYTLSANVDDMFYQGSGAFTGTGNEIDNLIFGGGGGARLDGRGGSDTLQGGDGNDSLAGGAGDDQLFATAGADTLDGGTGDDTARLAGAFADYTIARPNASDVVLSDRAGNVTTLRNIDTVYFADTLMTIEAIKLSGNVATTGNDALQGGAGNDTIDGLAGNDTMTGGGGDDVYVVSAAGDVIVESPLEGVDRAAVAFSAAGTYVLAENVENATVTAAAGIAVNVTGNAQDNILVGNAAANTLAGGAGNDTLNGAAGADSLAGGDGDDYYVVDAAGDRVVEGLDAGTDSVDTSLVSYTLAANVENLRYTGAAAFTGTGNGLDNTIQSGAGNDVLNGAAGDDVLTGGAGSDRLTGGAGADTFVLNSLAGADTITDFVSGTDHLALNLAALGVGNGDLSLDGADARDAPGGFASGAELVLFSQRAAGAGSAAAAAVIGSASSAYAAGETALFAVSTGSATTLYLFKSGDDDATVSAAELTQLAVLTGTPTTALADYLI